MKRLVKISTIAFFACCGSYTLYSSQNRCSLSDLALANIEALAGGATHDGCKYEPGQVCYDYIIKPGNSIGAPPEVSGEAYHNQVNYYDGRPE